MNCSQSIAGSEGCGAGSSAEGGLGEPGGGADVAAANTSSGKGGGTEAGRSSGDSTIGGETKRSRSVVSASFFASNGRSAVGSPGGRLSICNPASRPRSLVSRSSTERRAPVAFAIATRGSTKHTAMTTSRRKTRASIN